MPALMISTIKIKDREKLNEYLPKVSKIGTQFGAEMVFRGPAEGTILGEADHQMVVIVKFPSTTEIDALFNSPEYQPLIALRDAGAEMNIVKYDMTS